MECGELKVFNNCEYYIDFYVRNKPENITYGETLGETLDDKFLSFKTIERW